MFYFIQQFQQNLTSLDVTVLKKSSIATMNGNYTSYFEISLRLKWGKLHLTTGRAVDQAG
jgi:hypothetical protein